MTYRSSARSRPAGARLARKPAQEAPPPQPSPAVNAGHGPAAGIDVKPVHRPAARVIAIASGKGGVGKTFLSATLSQALSRAERHGRVLLVDLDLGLANVDVQLGLSPERDLGQVMAGQITAAEAVTTLPEAGFHVLAGRSGSGALAALAQAQLSHLLDGLAALAPTYGRVVLDLGAGADRTVRRLAAAAGTVLVVTTDEPTALTDAYAFIKLSQADAPEADRRVVVNLAANLADGQRTYATLARACARFLGAAPPLAGIIRRDAHVRDAIRAQTPLLTRHPNCDAAHDIEELAMTLAAPMLPGQVQF